VIQSWPELRDLALSLNLPEVTLAYPFGHESLKAFGKGWCYWGRIPAGVFICELDERAALRAADPVAFPFHPHYENYRLILVAAGHLDPDWARARLTRTWRDLAPKRFLKEWDARG
jgi:hypothetical protein